MTIQYTGSMVPQIDPRNFVIRWDEHAQNAIAAYQSQRAAALDRRRVDLEQQRIAIADRQQRLAQAQDLRASKEFDLRLHALTVTNQIADRAFADDTRAREAEALWNSADNARTRLEFAALQKCDSAAAYEWLQRFESEMPGLLHSQTGQQLSESTLRFLDIQGKVVENAGGSLRNGLQEQMLLRSRIDTEGYEGEVRTRRQQQLVDLFNAREEARVRIAEFNAMPPDQRVRLAKEEMEWNRRSKTIDQVFSLMSARSRATAAEAAMARASASGGAQAGFRQRTGGASSPETTASDDAMIEAVFRMIRGDSTPPPSLTEPSAVGAGSATGPLDREAGWDVIAGLTGNDFTADQRNDAAEVVVQVETARTPTERAAAIAEGEDWLRSQGWSDDRIAPLADGLRRMAREEMAPSRDAGRSSSDAASPDAAKPRPTGSYAALRADYFRLTGSAPGRDTRESVASALNAAFINDKLPEQDLVTAAAASSEMLRLQRSGDEDALEVRMSGFIRTALSPSSSHEDKMEALAAMAVGTTEMPEKTADKWRGAIEKRLRAINEASEKAPLTVPRPAERYNSWAESRRVGRTGRPFEVDGVVYQYGLFGNPRIIGLAGE